MGKFIDITGLRFNRLTVKKRSITDKDHFILWECECDCGKVVLVRAYCLKHGEIKSCGCLNDELRRQRGLTHGLSKLPVYAIWKSMKSRCYRKKDKRYDRYGGRGITVCDEWRNNPEVFVRWSMENGYKIGLTIDRRDNNLGYSPANCRFITAIENNRNSGNAKINHSIVLEMKDLYKSGLRQVDIADHFGITQQTVSKAVNNKSWKI